MPRREPVDTTSDIPRRPASGCAWARNTLFTSHTPRRSNLSPAQRGDCEIARDGAPGVRGQSAPHPCALV